MTDDTDLIEMVRSAAEISGDDLLNRAASALKTQALSLSEARAENERLTKEMASTEDALTEARHEPWPEWISAVLAVIRKHSGYDGFDDHDGVDLPQELDDAIEAIEDEAERWRIRAQAAERQRDEALAALDEVSAAIGSPRFMDPPDGGDVSLAEQVRRMSAALKASEEREAAKDAALRKVKHWAESRCPCHNEEPNPCPLCGASVENLEACKSAENTMPRDVLQAIRSALAEQSGAGNAR